MLYVYAVWKRVSGIPEAQLPASAAAVPHSRMLAELSTTALQCSFVAGACSLKNACLCRNSLCVLITPSPLPFSTGNVFFEVLFSDVGRFHSLNYSYFAFCTITMCMGAAVTAVATATSVFVNDLGSDTRKGTMCQQLGLIRTSVAQMYNISQVRVTLGVRALMCVV